MIKYARLPFDDATKDVLADYLEKGRPYLVKDKNEKAIFLNHRGQQLNPSGSLADHQIVCQTSQPQHNRYAAYAAPQLCRP